MARRFYEKDGNLDYWNGEASTGQPEGSART
jgi:hypothetical protein